MNNVLSNSVSDKAKGKQYSLLLLLAALLVLQGCASSIKVSHDPKYGPVTAKPAPRASGINGSLYVLGDSTDLFTDRKAFRVGDILTVNLSESTSGSTSTASATKKEDAIDLQAPTIFGQNSTNNPSNSALQALNNSITANREFKGSGDSSQSNSLTGQITVMVDEVYPNGNLHIRGEKIININQAAEFVRLAGIVRPQDIDANNNVQSSLVANATISYGAGGMLGDANTQGWASRFFNSGLWPF